MTEQEFLSLKTPNVSTRGYFRNLFWVAMAFKSEILCTIYTIMPCSYGHNSMGLVVTNFL